MWKANGSIGRESITWRAKLPGVRACVIPSLIDWRITFRRTVAGIGTARISSGPGCAASSSRTEGDSRKEAFDLYNHIDLKELKEAYFACIPQLGI